MISYQKVGEMFNDNTIFKADLLTLNECWQTLTKSPSYDPRHNQWINALEALINSKQADGLHLALTQQVAVQHRETKSHLTDVSKDLSIVKGEVSDIKRTLKETHGVHLWILLVAVLTLIAALVAAADVVCKWFSKNSSANGSESIRREQSHSTNK